MIAVSFALPAESSGLVARLRGRKSATSDETKIIHGKIDNRSVTIFHTGVGRQSCEKKIDDFFNNELPRVFIAAGFAGAVRNDIQAGELILAENFSDQRLLSEAQRVLNREGLRIAKLFTSPAIVDSINERNEIARASGADVVDMETEVIAQSCAARGIPMLSLRVVSDSPRNPFPAPPNVLFDMQLQRTNPATLLAYLFKHPIALWRLIQFGRQVAKARAALTSAIVKVIEQLPD